MRRLLPLALTALAAAPSAFSQGDPAVVARIIEEGKGNSQVWKTLEYISFEIGTRLTGSSGLMRANTWTRDYFVKQGLENAHLQKWGEIPVGFDRGPCSARMITPAEREFEFSARSWSAGTDGPVVGHVVREPKTLEELEAVRDQLPGAWLLGKSQRRRRGRSAEVSDVQKEINEAVAAAGIAGRVRSSRNDLVVTSGSWRNVDYANLPTDVSITIRRSDYDAVNSRVSDGEKVEIEVDLEHYFFEGPFPVFNTVAEIPGTEFPDEVIICSAHLDSWDGPGSMGTQDNGTGSSVMLETARILMAAGAQPRRTIRFILWTGEEQGLHGSRGYVESLSEEERAKISAVFVDDGGTNYQGGLACVESMLPMLEEATAPVVEAFPTMPPLHTTQDKMPRGGGSDHASFNAVGIPGFFWFEKNIEGRDEKSYRYIHHTQHDTPRYAVEEYLVQAATCQAVTAYNLAMADTMLPRYVPEETIEASAPVVDENFVPAKGPVTGRWKAVLTGEDAWTDEPFYIDVEMDAAGALRGKVKRDSGDAMALKKGTYEKETAKLAFQVDSTYGTLIYTATHSEGKLTGTLSNEGGSFSMPFKAERVAEEKKPEPDDKPTQKPAQDPAEKPAQKPADGAAAGKAAGAGTSGS